MYEDWHRASVNQMMDDFDDNYPDECSRAHCPECGYTIEFATLVVDKGGTFILPEDYDDWPGKMSRFSKFVIRD